MYAVAQYNQGIAKIIDARNWLRRHDYPTNSYPVLVKEYDKITDAKNHKYGKIDGKAAAHYIRQVDR